MAVIRSELLSSPKRINNTPGVEKSRMEWPFMRHSVTFSSDRQQRGSSAQRSLISVTIIIILSLTAVFSFILLPAPRASAVDPIHEYKFHNHEDLTFDLYQWQSDYPEIMELSTIGTSYLGHELWNVHLTNFQENRHRELPEIYLDGGHHGNEYCGSEITILVLQYLLENYGSDPDATYILDNAHIYITPMINPDGIDMDTRMNSRQVDLNRNYPYEWTNAATHGSGPASEIEVSSNIAFMDKHEFDLYLTGHTGIVYLIYPWGYTTDPSPDHNFYLKIEEEVESQWDIPTGQSSVALYVAYGTSKDYGYAGNFAPTWTFEVDDEQFVPVSGEAISQRLQPIFECYIYLMKESISGKWWPNPQVQDMTIRNEDSDGFQAVFNINNSGYLDVVNGTATLDVGGKTMTSLFSVGQFNETNLTFNVTGDFTGKHDVLLRLDYTRLTLNTSQPRTTTYQTTIAIGEESVSAGVMGGGIALIVLLGIFIVVFVRRGKAGDPEDEDIW